MEKELNIRLKSHYDFTPKEGIMPINQQDKYAILQWGNVDDKELSIFIDTDTFLDVRKHAQKRTDREVGGFLIGDAMQEKENLFIQITHLMKVQEIQHKSGEFIFTHGVWKMIDSIMSERYPDKQLLGWYHTHPGIGLFLSPEDKFIQNNFFNHPWQVTLVLDPLTKYQLFYYSKNKKLVNIGFYIYTAKQNQQLLRRLKRELELGEKREKCGRYRAHHIFT
ncbi:MAG: Mov34/MPN/PAD-1 family protein [bacterium]